MSKTSIVVSRPFENIPIPTRIKTKQAKKEKFPLEEMEVGDSFKITFSKKKNSKFRLDALVLRADIDSIARRKKLNLKFAIRSLESSNPDLVVYGVWRVK